MTDKLHAENESTDLFFKGLYLSFFESNDLDTLDNYRTHERAETPVRKRKSPINFSIFSTMQNSNHQLNANSSPLTVYNETNDIYKSKNNETETTKTGLNEPFKDVTFINSTLTFDKAAQTNATREQRTHNNTESFLIRVY